jgi:hypothetical protein
MGLLGSGVKNPNYILRFSLFVFMGILAMGAVLYWKSQLLLAADYQEFPKTEYQLRIQKQNRQTQLRQQSIKNLEE